MGQPVPEFIDSEQCLFCHREGIGTAWQQSRHGRTTRHLLDDRGEVAESDEAGSTDAAQATHELGGGKHTRLMKLLRPGKFALLTADGWNEERFGERCAGCHATGVDGSTRLFSSIGIDCYACHGDIDLKHSADASLVWLSKKKRKDARAIVSICGQCHLRGGRSRSAGLAYPNNFIAGDNLLQDYEVDFSLADRSSLNPSDRHVYFNVREVALHGNEKPHCLSCHRMHSEEGNRHRRVLRSEVCWVCHEEARKLTAPAPYAVHSETCEY